MCLPHDVVEFFWEWVRSARTGVLDDVSCSAARLEVQIHAPRGNLDRYYALNHDRDLPKHPNAITPSECLIAQAKLGTHSSLPFRLLSSANTSASSSPILPATLALYAPASPGHISRLSTRIFVVNVGKG